MRSTTREKGAHRDRPAPPSKSFCRLSALVSTKVRKNNLRTILKHCVRRAQARQSFPFSFLAVDCQLLIFSFLSEVEKCRAAMVCANWAELMRSPELWRVANFMRLGTFLPWMPGMIVSVQEFDRWQEWVYKYAFHLTSRCAGLHVIRTCFDLTDMKSKWTDFFLQFLEEVHCSELQELEVNWTLTYSNFNSSFQSGEMSLKMNEQFSSFSLLIDKCIQCSPKVSKMKLPFDWSEQSVEVLIHFSQLHTLEVNCFWVSKAVSLKDLTFLTTSLPNLKAFTLAITWPNHYFCLDYSLPSPALQYSALTRGRRSVFRILELPALKELRVKAVLETMYIIPCFTACQRQWYRICDLIGGHPASAERPCA